MHYALETNVSLKIWDDIYLMDVNKKIKSKNIQENLPFKSPCTAWK